MALRVHVFSDGAWDMRILAACRTKEYVIYSMSSETSQHLYQESRGSNCDGINYESGLFKWWCDSKLSVLDIDQHPSAYRDSTCESNIDRAAWRIQRQLHIRKALTIGVVKRSAKVAESGIF